ncbi:MAG TPA: cation transporter, partial [Nitrolancea sp.]|nr:cation transporter [Nitrolancea sp.]
MSTVANKSPIIVDQENDPAADVQELTFPVEGMTCASCVRRVEKSLTKLPGVREASVNLASENAKVVFDGSVVGLEQFQGAIEKAGYRIGAMRTNPDAIGVDHVAQTSNHDEGMDPRDLERQREIADLKRKSLVSLGVGLVMMALMYLPLHIDSLVLGPFLLIAATVIQVSAGRIFYAAAWAGAKHASTNMNTLVAVGTSVAYGYSAFVTLWPSVAERWGFPYHLYYESAVIIIALILLGRWMEARSKKQMTTAIRSLMGLQARTARVVRDGVERDIDVDAVKVGDLVRVRPGEKIPVDGL